MKGDDLTEWWMKIPGKERDMYVQFQKSILEQRAWRVCSTQDSAQFCGLIAESCRKDSQQKRRKTTNTVLEFCTKKLRDVVNL